MKFKEKKKKKRRARKARAAASSQPGCGVCAGGEPAKQFKTQMRAKIPNSSFKKRK